MIISQLKVNQDWVVHSAEKRAFLFNEKQLSIIRSFHNEESVTLIHSLLENHMNEIVEEEKMIKFCLPPVEIILIKRGWETTIALRADHEDVHVAKAEHELFLADTSFVSHSSKMREVMDIVRKISYVDSIILLLGKSGTGKSMIAKLIHKSSHRADKSFLSVNCGAIPEPLMEAELFGYTHGSFTGGQKGGKKGIFEMANGGTLFLDEVGEIPLNLQVKLLEVLQENSIRPIGGTDQIPIDVRIIAATNQNLHELVQKKRFREDLYYRLNVVPIEIPPLNERVEDIEFLSRKFLERLINKYGMFKKIHPDVLEVFGKYDWPGNVRELENVIERLFITTEQNEIQLQHLPPYFFKGNERMLKGDLEFPIMPLKEAKRMIEKQLITKAYEKHKSTYKVAELLQTNQSTIAKKLIEYRKEGSERR
ncbi:sigma-54-dependent Fis family transcriptional regulator [Ammoniphilus sp. YIM 78166]|uniref:sigma-54 interaction domain-containing protein n=1 Tax=Ammoniphilus sp. YIM 78166 TaxID=1644106 RepID=UPI001F102513|nr:sigma 54-interacting transcriptional regulator [Ammoniphilus sp. YIM 78166]